MKKVSIIVLLPSIVVVTVLSCKKTKSSKISNYTKLPFNQLFVSLRSTPQNFSVAAGRDTIVYGTNTSLHFYSNSFKDANGSIITGGVINLQLVEMYTPGDMIKNRATTTLSNGQLLRSGGEVNIIATVNGQEVYANMYGISFAQPNISSEPMALFYGNSNNLDSVVTWSVSTNIGDTIHSTSIDTIYSQRTPTAATLRIVNSYSFNSCSKFRSVNCDYFYSNDSPKTSVSIIVPDSSFNPTNTQFYIVLPTINCIVSNVLNTAGGYAGTYWNAASHTVKMTSEGNTDIIPTGMNYKVVAITNKNGSYYYYQSSGISKMGMTINATMKQDTEENIKISLSTL